MSSLLPFIARLPMVRTASTSKVVDLAGSTGWNTVLDYDGVGCLRHLWATLPGTGTTGQMLEVVVDDSTICLGYFSKKDAGTYYPTYSFYYNLPISAAGAGSLTTDGTRQELNLNFRNNVTIRAFQTATNQIDVYYALDVVE